MHVVFLIEIRGNAHRGSTRAHHAHGCGDGFQHHITKFTCADDVALAFQGCGFNREQFTAHFRPSQTCDLAYAVFWFGHTEIKTAHAQVIMQIRRIHHNGLRRFRFYLGFRGFGFGFVFCQYLLHHHFAGNAGNFTVQWTHTCFTGVVAHNIAHRWLFNHRLILFDTIGFDLLRYQILHGNADFFIFGITRQADDFHAVKQSRWNVQGIRCGDEHHIRQIVFHLSIMIDKAVVLLRI